MNNHISCPNCHFVQHVRGKDTEVTCRYCTKKLKVLRIPIFMTKLSGKQVVTRIDRYETAAELVG
jgi:hypothetical protein